MYSLLKAIYIVKNVDTSINRIKVFEDIAKKNILVNVVFQVFNKTAGTPIATVLVLLYGLKCFLSVRMPVKKNMELLCFASYPNEVTAINRLKSEFSEIDYEDLHISTKYVFKPENWLSAVRYFFLIPRLYKFSKKCKNNYHFLPACRIFSTLAFYLRYKQIFKKINSKGILIANHYSPECTSLMVAAYSNLIKVIYTNHANIPKNTPYLPSSLSVDLALLTSEAVLKKINSHANLSVCYKLIGYEQPKEQQRLFFINKPIVTIGIFLTALTNKDRVQELIDRLHEIFPTGQIMIRLHPIALLKENFSYIFQDSQAVYVSKNKSLRMDIKKCDLVVCGNTSAVIEILKGGCPVVYDAKLDYFSYDIHGFVDSGLILPIEDIDKRMLNSVIKFYKRSEWEKVMQFYDASYFNDEKKLLRDAKKKLKQVLKIDSVC